MPRSGTVAVAATPVARTRSAYGLAMPRTASEAAMVNPGDRSTPATASARIADRTGGTAVSLSTSPTTGATNLPEVPGGA